MLARTSIETRFYDYVCRRDPSGYYDWANFANCACGQFLREEGIEIGNDRNLYYRVWGRYPDCSLTPLGEANAGSLNLIAYGNGDVSGCTWGALRERLEAAGYGVA